jgi:PKD repeat protein
MSRGRGISTRRTVTRDALTLLAGALLAIVLARVLAPPAPVGAIGSPDPNETGGIIAVESNGPGPTLPPLDTVGPIVNPSTGLSATPTPIPIITLGPPTPTPSGSVGPSGSLKPTPKPTFGPPPTPTPPPPPVAVLSCQVALMTVTCDGSGSHNVSAWDWDWGDGTPHATTASPLPHTYTAAGLYSVVLVVTGLNGVSTDQDQYSANVPGP